jgi:hypothetical protein
MPVPTGQIQVTRQGSDDASTCGTCGALVAFDHLARHISWHNTPHTSAQVVTNNVLANRPGGNN